MADFPTRLRNSYQKHPILYNIGMAVAAVFLLIWLTLIFLDIWTHHGATAVVPEIKNMDYYQAEQKLRESKLNIEVSDSVYYSDLSPQVKLQHPTPGTILESWPKAGAVVKPGRQVYVTIVAYSPKEVIVPTPLDNISSRQAISVLQSMGITNIRLVSVPSMYADNVERALYNGKPIGVGTSLPVNATVTLEVGKAVIPDNGYEWSDSTGVDSLADDLDSPAEPAEDVPQSNDYYYSDDIYD